ncbi:DUF6636 domain-containing protein [Mycolicibacterium palauense]|uniref:DUF6636 domain-containing protein n=1 Tax=Mycolicibacterium palauense TaxID=2034511 RepID=UPI00159BA56F|nr:DUF6636 domain-containing protein [Mycolicibacterium palauense]
MRRWLWLAVAPAFVAAAAPAHADITGFTSPSGNIGCILDDGGAGGGASGYVRCDIGERSWSPPARPADCPDETDFGQGIALHTYGPAAFVCAGDTALGAGGPLAYGNYQAGGGVSCTSKPTAMTCSNSDGHGFSLSRESYDLF